VRLTVGQSGQLPATDHVVAEEIAKKLGFSSAGALNENLQERMRAVRQAYDRITAVAET
jgi:glutamine synthetase adenylyltransferase